MNRLGNLRLYVVLGSVFVLAGAWRGSEWVAKSLLSLPIKQAPRVERPSAALDAKNFYPVWVRTAKATPATAAPVTAIDDLFKREDELEVHKPVEPQYGAQFQQVAMIDGIADNGVFVNGEFYKVGARMEAYALQGAGKPVVPVVESVNKGTVVFRVGAELVRFVAKREVGR